MPNENGKLSTGLDLLDIPVDVTVNRKARIGSLADKARANGFLWREPQSSELGEEVRTDSAGVVIERKVKSAVTVTDVDGRVYRTLKTETVSADGVVKRSDLGIYDGALAGRFYGRRSVNFKPDKLTPREIVNDVLRLGFSVAPGFYDPERDSERRSHRSRASLVRTSLVLFDGDRWSDACPPPDSLEDLLTRYPAIPKFFNWIGESVSSRSSLKPELRFRLMRILPEPFFKAAGEDKPCGWKVMTKEICELFPWIDPSVASDATRFSFGNARKDAISVFFPRADGVSIADVRRWKAIGTEEKTAERARWESQPSEKRVARTGVSGKSPRDVFLEEDIEVLLRGQGCTHLSGVRWNFQASGAGKSFELTSMTMPGKSPTVRWYLKPFSSSMKATMPPNAAEDKPINAHRWVFYQMTGLDFPTAGDTRAWMDVQRRLADFGYGEFREPGKVGNQTEKPQKSARQPVLKQVVKLDKPSSIEKEIILSAVRAQLQDDLRAWVAERDTPVRFALVRSDTGIGKTTAVVTTVERLLHVSPTAVLADEAHASALRAELARLQTEMSVYGQPCNAGMGDFVNALSGFDFELDSAMRWRARASGFEDARAKSGVYGDVIPAPIEREDGRKETAEEREERLARGAERRARLADACFSPGPAGQTRAMCAMSDVSEKLESAGWNTGKVLCFKSCAFLDRCSVFGWVSQFQRARKAAQLMVSLGDLQLISDPAFAGFADAISNRKDARVAVIDDCPISNLAPRRTVSLSAVRKMISERTEVWVPSVDIPVEFTAALSTHFLREIETMLLSSESQIADIRARLRETFQADIVKRELSSLPFYFYLERVEREQQGEEDSGLFAVCAVTGRRFSRVGMPADIFKGKTLGSLYRERFSAADAIYYRLVRADNLPGISDFEHGWVSAFFDKDVAVRAVSLPYRRGEEPGLEFVLKPRLNFKKTIALNATARKSEVEAVLGEDVHVIESDKPRWAAGSRIYQINTARYTDENFVIRKDGRIAKAGPRLRCAVDLISKHARAGKRVLVVGRKWLLDKAIASEMQPVLENANIEILNYGAVRGLNAYADFDYVFLFLPSPGRSELERVASALYRLDFDTLDFVNRKDGVVKRAGFELKMPVFCDERVQKIFEQLIEDSLYQAAARLRPTTGEGKTIVLMTAFPVSGLTDRADTTFFSFEDASAVTDIRDVRPRECIDKRLARGDDKKEIAEDAGVSLRTVYRRKGPIDKSERDARIRELISEQPNISSREIARVTRIPRATVNRLRKTIEI